MQLVLIVEGVPIENAVFAAPQILVTVSKDSVLSAWRLHIKGNGNKRGDVSLQREGTLRGHTSKVTCLAASSAWSFLVTGSQVGVVGHLRSRSILTLSRTGSPSYGT